MRYLEASPETGRLRATIEEFAKAKGITVAEALRHAIALVEQALAARLQPGPSPTPPAPAAPARHLPIGEGAYGCVAWCPACRADYYAREAAGR